MNTALLDSAIERLATDSSTEDISDTVPSFPPSRPVASPSAQERPATLPIAVLTNDPRFADQIRTALDGESRVIALSTADDAVELASTGECSILVTDTTFTRNGLETLTQRLRTHDPATTIVVAGNSEHSGLFISLQSSGAVDAFLLKPITSAATQLVIEAATRRYRSYGSEVSQTGRKLRERAQQNERLRAVATDFESGTTIKAQHTSGAVQRTHAVAAKRRTAASWWLRPSWSLIAIVAVIAAGVVAWTFSQRSSGIESDDAIAKHLAQAEAALAANRLLDARDGAVHHFQAVLAIDPKNFAALRGLDAVAREISKQAQAYMLQQRLADAAIALSRLRELQPSYAELPLLDAQFKNVQDSLVASHIAIQVPLPVLPEQKPEALEAGSKPRVEGHRASNVSTSPRRSKESAPRTVLPTTDTSLNEAQSSASSAPDLFSSSAASPQVQSEASTDPVETSPPSAAALELPPPQPEAAPKLIKYVAPEYPSEAYARRMEGWIEISMEIAPSGEVIAPRIEAGDKRQLFGRSALAAVRQWKFEQDPARAAGQRSSVRVKFQMP